MASAMHLAVPGGFSAPRIVKDVIDLYLPHARNELEAESFVNRKAELADFCGEFGPLTLAEAKPYHLQLWLNSHPDWASDWTRKRCVSGVQRAFNWAVKLGVIDRNPFAGFTVPTGERGEAATKEEFQAMLRHSSGGEFKRFVVALRYTAARPDELARATWDDLDLDRCCLELDRHKTRKKSKLPRRIMLHPVVLGLLDWTLRQPGHHVTLLFPNSRGGKWSRPAISWRVRQLQDGGHIGPTTTLYSLRHLTITQAVLAGVDIATIAELAGHARITTTAYYFHVAGKTDHLQRAMRQVFRGHE